MRDIIYIVKKGDNIYDLSAQYNVTVQSIIKSNPTKNMQNVKPGDEIKIFVDSDEIYVFANDDANLHDNMRKVWEQHVWWTRELLLSIAHSLPDQAVVTDRLLRNPKDIANLFRPYYGNDIANTLDRLLTEHLVIGGQIMTNAKQGNNSQVTALQIKWGQNADAIAKALASINKNYDEEHWRDMLHEHLDLTTSEVVERLTGKYRNDIETFDQIEDQALEMADELTGGIQKAFPERFN